MQPVQRSVEVRRVGVSGSYRVLAVDAPEVAAGARPGQFVTFGVGGSDTALLLRRAFSVARAIPSDGTVEVVVAVAGAGTAWLVGRRPGDRLDLVGPLGRAFTLPSTPGTMVLVGGGYGAAALVALAAVLRDLDCRVELLLGAATADRLYGVTEAAGLADRLVCTTDDGSTGRRGWVTDVLPDLLDGADTIYACGPMGMLRAVTTQAVAAGVPAEVAVEEAMACGIGVCMTCVLPVVGNDGETRMLRSCVEGPVFAGDRVRFDDVGTVPPDAVGAAGGRMSGLPTVGV